MNATFKIIISMIIWGSIGIFIKQINFPSLEIAFLRAVIGAGVLGFAGIRLKQKGVKIRGKNILYLMISGAAMGLNWFLLFQGYSYTTIANATLSYYFAPVIVVVLSPLVLKEKFTRSKLISVLGAMAGLFLILSHQSVNPQLVYNHFKGIGYGLTAAGLYASVILFNKQIKGLPGYEITLVQVSAAALVLLPFVLFRNNLQIESFQGNKLFFILILGAVHTGLAFLLYFSSLKNVKAQSAAVLSYLDPISAVVFSTLFLAEPLNSWQVIGGILILGSTLFGELPDKRKTQVEQSL